MKNSTNALDTMLCLQKAENNDSGKRQYTEITWFDADEDISQNELCHQEDAQEALATISRCVKFFGNSATQELEEHIEFLQEEFLAHLESLLQEHQIEIQEKLMLSISNDNTLILQCDEQEDALLTALGTDEKLIKHLQSLRKVALISRGLDYMLSVQTNKNSEYMPQYRVCTKGALSHFYLKN